MNEEDMIFEEVALRKESVDRKCSVILLLMGSLLSLSARRAWIEKSWLLSFVSDSV